MVYVANVLYLLQVVEGLMSRYKSNARKAPVETSVSAQLYVMTPDSLCCPGKDNRPQNQHR